MEPHDISSCKFALQVFFLSLKWHIFNGFLHVMNSHLELEESVFRTSLCGLLWPSVTLYVCVHTHACVPMYEDTAGDNWEKQELCCLLEPGLIVLGILQLISSPCTPAKHLLPHCQPNIQVAGASVHQTQVPALVKVSERGFAGLPRAQALGFGCLRGIGNT